MKGKPVLVCALVCAIACVAAPILFARASGTRISAQNSSQDGAQSPEQSRAQNTAQDPRFAQFVYDVASIKPYKPDPNATSTWMGSKETPDGYFMSNAPLTTLVFAAYRTEHTRVSGGPDWLNKDPYEVEAKMDSDVADALQKLSPADQKLARRHMMQALVQDRLKLTVHMETKEISIYELVIAKNGPKMKETTDPAAPNGGLSVSGSGGTIVWDARDMPISNVTNQLSFAAGQGRPVYDKTGLTGRYTFTLRYAPDRGLTAVAPGTDSAALPDNAPPLAAALQEQLGLKLVSATGPMDYIVIDHAERPSAN